MNLSNARLMYSVAVLPFDTGNHSDVSEIQVISGNSGVTYQRGYPTINLWGACAPAISSCLRPSSAPALCLALNVWRSRFEAASSRLQEAGFA